MGWFSRIFGGSPGTSESEHAVLINFAYGKPNLEPLFELEDDLERGIGDADVGEYDGNEIATDGTVGTLYMYGPDADALFRVVEPILAARDFMQDATVTLRYGPPNPKTPETKKSIRT